MCQVNNERERNILGEEEDQIGREPIRWRRRRKEKKRRKKTKVEKKENEVVGGKTLHGEKKEKGREGKRRFSRCSDGRSSIVRDLKLVHTMRATCGY